MMLNIKDYEGACDFALKLILTALIVSLIRPV